jgi:hypothetical protein
MDFAVHIKHVRIYIGVNVQQSNLRNCELTRIPNLTLVTALLSNTRTAASRTVHVSVFSPISSIHWGKLRTVLWGLFAARRRLKLFSILPQRLEANEKQTEDNQCDKCCFFPSLSFLFSSIFIPFLLLTKASY